MAKNEAYYELLCDAVEVFERLQAAGLRYTQVEELRSAFDAELAEEAARIECKLELRRDVLRRLAGWGEAVAADGVRWVKLYVNDPHVVRADDGSPQVSGSSWVVAIGRDGSPAHHREEYADWLPAFEAYYRALEVLSPPWDREPALEADSG